MIKKEFSKKEIFVILPFLILTILFLPFLYLSRSWKLKKIKEDLNIVQREVKELSGLTKDDASLGKFVLALKAKTKALREKLPKSGEEAIKGLTKLALEHGLTIISITNSFKELETKKEKLIFSSNKKIKKVYLEMQAEGNFLQLGKFLQALREEFELFTILNKLSIKGPHVDDKLKIQIELHFYLVG